MSLLILKNDEELYNLAGMDTEEILFGILKWLEVPIYRCLSAIQRV